MPSFVTNNRMSAELRARVQQSLKTDALSRVGGANRRTGHLLFRVLAFCGVLGFASFLTITFRQAEQEFQAEKATLVERYQKQTAPFDSAFEKRLERIDDVLSHALDPYPGDVWGAQAGLSEPRQLEALLAGPVVYLRGPQRGFRTDSERRAQAKEGAPDALVRCLMVPPPSADEVPLLRHLGHVYQPSRLRGRFVSLARAWQAMDFVRSPFKTRLAEVDTARMLPFLEAELRSAELSQAADLKHASSFFYVLDEPKPRGVVADFDGEAEHYVRFGLVDLEDGSTKLRLRRLVNPDWISEKSRLAYSRELDSCRLAFQLHGELSAQVPSSQHSSLGPKKQVAETSVPMSGGR